MKVGALPEDDTVAAATAPGQQVPSTATNRLGVVVAELTDKQREAMDVDAGIVVREVRQGPAAMVGLRAGDVITSLDNKQIKSVEQFEDITEALPTDRSVSMRVVRQGRASYITFRLAD
jgi:serine protease Do